MFYGTDAEAYLENDGENKWTHHLPAVGVTVGFVVQVCSGRTSPLQRLSFLGDLIHSKKKKTPDVASFSWNHSRFLMEDTWFVIEDLNSVVFKLFMLEFITRNKPEAPNRKVIQAVGFMILRFRLYRSFYGAVFPVAVRRLAGSFYLIVSQRQ